MSIRPSDFTNVKVNLASTQAPTEFSFGPSADVLVAKPVTGLTTQPTELNLQFARVIAVGKMAIKNLNTTKEEKVKKITFTAAGKAVTGRSYINFTNAKGVEYGYLSYGVDNVVLDYSNQTIAANGMTAYFTCWPFELTAGDTFSVVVETENYIFTKNITLTGDKSLAFKVGSASAFNVNFDGIEGVKKEQTWTWTAASGDLGTKTPYSATLNNKAWSVTRSKVVYTGYSSSCIQLGSGSGAETVTLTSNAFTGTIKSVSVECSSYNGAHKVDITVGGKSYATGVSTASWQKVGTVSGKGTSSGEIVIKFNAGSKALYIKSISITYEVGSTGGEEPGGEEPGGEEPGGGEPGGGEPGGETPSDYTFATSKSQSNTAYATNYDVTISDITWSVPGNQNFSGYVRIGGKSLSSTVRYIYSKTALPFGYKTITISTNGISNSSLSVESVVCKVYSSETSEFCSTLY